MNGEVSEIAFREFDETEDGSHENPDGGGQKDPKQRAPIMDEVVSPEADIRPAEGHEDVRVDGAAVHAEAEYDQGDGEEDERSELDRETGDADL